MVTRPKKKKNKDDAGGEDGEVTSSSRKRSRTATTSSQKTKRTKTGDPYDFTSSEEEDSAPSPQSHDPTDGPHDQDGDAPMDTGDAAVTSVALDAERWVLICTRKTVQGRQ